MALLETRQLGKRYPGVTALHGVDLLADAGEVHALVGANGAGKSTLLNLLCGVQRPSDGEILIGGKPVTFTSPARALELGIVTVHQEFSLVPQLSVARNVYLGREPTGRLGLVDGAKLRRQTYDLFERFGLALDPDREVSHLSVAEQQLVEIARALSFEARILILDEPTAVLSLAEQEKLFAIIRRLRAEGLLIFFVSHHLREVLAIADRVTVLRDGRRVATTSIADMTFDGLVDLIVGESKAYDKQSAAVAQPVDHAAETFSIRYSTDRGDSSLDLSGGEIVGIAGLVGAGRTTFARALAGLGSQSARASILHNGAKLRNDAPRRAIASGMIYITEDRKKDGLFAALDIVANTTPAVLRRLGIGPLRSPAREAEQASALLKRLRLVAGSLRGAVTDLSGGNQQKVLIGRALMTRPSLIICDEPTRGVDVGAKQEIHAILRELAMRGAAVLVISSEIEELMAVSDKIVVMKDRRIVAALPAEDASETVILRLASGTTEPETLTDER